MAQAEGPVAALRLGLPAPVQGGFAITLVEGSRPYVSQRHSRLDVDVVINGEPIDRWHFEYGDTNELARRSLVPHTAVAGSERLDIEFRLLNPEAPANVGDGPDSRLLGLNVRGLLLHQLSR